MRLHCHFLIFSLLFSVLTARELPTLRFFDIDNPPQGTFVDEWMEIYLAGNKVGYSHTEFSRAEDTVFTRSHTYMRIDRSTEQLTIEVSQNTEETLEGLPISVSNQTLMGNTPMEMHGVIENNTLQLSLKQDNHFTEQSYPFPANARLLWGMARHALLRGYAPGTRYTLPFYSPDIAPLAPVEAEVEVFEPESIDYFGTPLECTRLEMTLRAPATDLVIISWIDENLRTVKTALSSGSFSLEMYLTTQAQAQAEFDTQEIFNASLLQLSRGIRKDAQKVVYALELPTGNFPKQIPTTQAQSIQQIAPQTLHITVEKTDHQRLRERVSDLSSESFLHEYLQSNIILNLDDPELHTLLERSQAMQHPRTSKRAAKLREFVSEFIENKGLNIGFATSYEICRKPEGDCTEHAVLLAALGRLAGIPTRVASGLAYLPYYDGQEDRMGYHMWTQFYMDGQWVDFDSAMGESECSPTRIALATSSFKDGSTSEISFALWNLIGKIKVSILSEK